MNLYETYLKAMTKIFIVEDDCKIAELLKDYFKQLSFNVTVFRRGDTVLTEIKSASPDVILLDLMLPGKDGLTLCREIRSFSNVPIIMVTAKKDEVDILLGLEIGADDYVCKPFSPREVVTRVKAVLRRSNSYNDEIELIAGPITVNPVKHAVTAGDSNLRLTPNEFELLKTLVSKPDWLFTRSDLISKIQGNNLNGHERIVDSHIKNLRKKIKELLPGSEFIKTVYGLGYSFTVPQPTDALNEDTRMQNDPIWNKK